MRREELRRELLDDYFKDLAKAFRKENGKNAQAEIILIGGAAILANHEFRQATTDVDALIFSNASLKSAINEVADKYNLENGWLNDGFKHTCSYTNQIALHSKHYKKFGGVLNVRIVEGEYLIAMKLMAGRMYKYDKSDVVGVLMEYRERGIEISVDDVVKAVGELYGKEACIPENSMDFFNKLMEFDNLKAVYDDARIYERLNKETLVEISDKHPEWFKGDRDIEALIRRKQKEEPKYIGLQINDNNELISITTNGNIILQEDANVLKILHDIERNNPDYALDPGTKKAVESYSNKNT